MVCSHMKVVICLDHLVYEIIFLTQQLSQVAPPPHPRRADLIPDWPTPHVEKVRQGMGKLPLPPPHRGRGGPPIGQPHMEKGKGGSTGSDLCEGGGQLGEGGGGGGERSPLPPPQIHRGRS